MTLTRDDVLRIRAEYLPTLQARTPLEIDLDINHPQLREHLPAQQTDRPAASPPPVPPVGAFRDCTGFIEDLAAFLLVCLILFLLTITLYITA